MAPEARVLVVDDEPMVRTSSRATSSGGVRGRGGRRRRASAGGVRSATPGSRVARPDAATRGRVRGLPPDSARAASPVIMITARGQTTDRIVGLEIGADDYVSKPFLRPRSSPGCAPSCAGPQRLPERAAQTRCLLRRTRAGPRSREVRVAGAPVALTPKEFDLLHFLASSPGDGLLAIATPRRALGPRLRRRPADGHRPHSPVAREDRTRAVQPARLVTVWGAGYRFEP